MSALNEKDIKKMVALSTLRQLGLIVLRIGSGWLFITFLHLITHAFFKAIMFIRVGNIIHSSQLYQAIKNTGILAYSSPLNRSTMILARARLCGSPFTAAFFSKEPIIEIRIYNNSRLGIITFIILRLSMTLLYSSRLIKIVLIHFNSITPIIHISEVDANLNKGIFTLSLPSFSRGSVIASLIYLKPSIFLYSLTVKIFIFSSFIIIFVVLIVGNYPVISTGLVYLFPI
jgi:NADH:ubiquinone oxidoreductase subunit 5 (subunit L)/multisubunit Na+/H+ antiporter MnhA subunit